MATKAVINVDLADVFAAPNRKGFLHTMAWGDHVDVEEVSSVHVKIKTVKFETHSDGSILPVKTEAFITPTKSSKLKPADLIIPSKQNRVLKVNFVDVQQGDGAVIESPDGKIILIDGGDNQLFARYLAARFRSSTAAKAKKIDCILVTHGDADHYKGLVEIHESETHKEPKKRLFIAPERVYHNGLVKRPSTKNGKKTPDKELLGPTKKVGDETILTGLVDDLLSVPDTEMNQPFKAWKDALTNWNGRSPIEFRHLSFGDDDAFDFFKAQDLEIQVLGPLLTTKGSTTGLKFLGKPPKGPRIGHESLSLDESDFNGLDASHTINGHSIVFRLRYGGFSYLFTGDLNDEASRILAQRHQQGEINLRSEVFKVPHHGSADFSGAFFQMVSPIVSVVSSGDESARKEYIHPRATLMGSLGKYSRVAEPLVFVTELVAFFQVEGWSQLTDPAKATKRGDFFGFSRAAFGIVKTRTDGERFLVYTDSGKANMKEAYAYTLDANGMPIPSSVIRA
ncbi:ComEC/Rec2 family competence protein [Blastopirellula marina]|uniref:Probable late competence protein n=1 Tax=Blastopirellula marina DSM 3645 TaxID=314230 RepID=A3ZUH9_9BACT|nr:MBL fold metallo-hydrolase [Blastopirellula marina]EAQ79889.1 probable late competence protein [Blastopirellula marina DSM 3645]